MRAVLNGLRGKRHVRFTDYRDVRSSTQQTFESPRNIFAREKLKNLCEGVFGSGGHGGAEARCEAGKARIPNKGSVHVGIPRASLCTNLGVLNVRG